MRTKILSLRQTGEFIRSLVEAGTTVMECFPLEILKLIIARSCLFRDAVAFISCSRSIHDRLVSRNQSVVDVCILLCPDQYSGEKSLDRHIHRETRLMLPEGYHIKRKARNLIVRAAKTYMYDIFMAAGAVTELLNEDALQSFTLRILSSRDISLQNVHGKKLRKIIDASNRVARFTPSK